MAGPPKRRPIALICDIWMTWTNLENIQAAYEAEYHVYSDMEAASFEGAA